jgi:hypothetical protein
LKEAVDLSSDRLLMMMMIIIMIIDSSSECLVSVSVQNVELSVPRLIVSPYLIRYSMVFLGPLATSVFVAAQTAARLKRIEHWCKGRRKARSVPSCGASKLLTGPQYCLIPAG